MRLIGKMALAGTMLASAIAIALPAQAATTITVTGNLGGSLAIQGLYNNGTQSFPPQFVTLTGTSSADAPTDFSGGYSGYQLSSLTLASSVNGSDGIVDFGSDYVFGGGNGVLGFGKLNGDILFAFSGANFALGSTTPAAFTVTNASLTNTPGSVSFTSGNSFGSSVVTTTAAVPEPATWLTMILGFGMVGGALRRRQRNLATTVRFA